MFPEYWMRGVIPLAIFSANVIVVIVNKLLLKQG